MNCFWDNSDNIPGRCAKVDEHFSVPAAQFCEEGVRHLTGLGSSLPQDLNVQLTSM